MIRSSRLLTYPKYASNMHKVIVFKRRVTPPPSPPIPFFPFVGEDAPFPRRQQDTADILEWDSAYRKLNPPWPIGDPARLYRVYDPDDLWDLGALREAIQRQLHLLGLDPEHEEGESSSVPDTLHHIFRCWIENLKPANEKLKNRNLRSKERRKLRREHTTTGPEFLIHVLRDYYGADPDFEEFKGKFKDLDGRETADGREVAELMAACDATGNATRGREFHVFLATFYRGFIEFEIDEVRVRRTRCWLEDVVHAKGALIKMVPRVSEADLLDTMFFEDEEPNLYRMNNKGAYEPEWRLTAVIIAPVSCEDNFFGYPDPPKSDPDVKGTQTARIKPKIMSKAFTELWVRLIADEEDEGGDAASNAEEINIKIEADDIPSMDTRPVEDAEVSGEEGDGMLDNGPDEEEDINMLDDEPVDEAGMGTVDEEPAAEGNHDMLNDELSETEIAEIKRDAARKGYNGKG
ncbi:hypothetical protein BDV95DRAFT_556597 [Massariosphaeria phaeospora]|uniref:Uncharacterized protein n=1 Tax=Massariosphaeria phaeospora TaxID=100035 RepID=A0A7C8IJN5_9PLEO|nr:hypothetical protein BDV95DRAFT_556597 [Massariosphaeria phaeospora]